MSYQIVNKNGIQYLVIPEMEETGIQHFFTTRKAPQHGAIPFVNQESFVMVRQVHGDNILVIDSPLEDISLFIRDAMQKPCDAIMTNQRPMGIGIVTADCLPALLYDPVQGVTAAVHAGWRGTVQGILPKVVCQMTAGFGCKAEDVLVGVGPSIGPCCYTVGKAVMDPVKSINPRWEKYLTLVEDGKAKLDLAGLNTSQMEDAGILKKNIFTAGLCTACHEDLFYCYRRDGIGTGRMISGIIL